MTRALWNRIQETSTSTGAGGTITLAGAVAGFRAFSTMGDGWVGKVLISEGNAWEIRRCTYTLSGTTLNAGDLIDSSTGSRITFTSATKNIYVLADAATLTPYEFNLVNDFGADPTFFDDCSAILQNAMSVAMNERGRLYCPPGIYKFSRALQDTGAGGVNAQVAVPQVGGSAFGETTGQRSLVVRGATPAPSSGESTAFPVGQTIFRSTLSSGSGTLPAFMSSQHGTRNNVHLEFSNLIVDVVPGCPITHLNFGDQQDVIVRNVMMSSGSVKLLGVTLPTGGTYGLILPQVNNPACVIADSVCVFGASTGFKLGELLQGGRLDACACVVGMEIPFAHHGNMISVFGAYECQVGIRSTGSTLLGARPGSHVVIGLYDLEIASPTSTAAGGSQSWQEGLYQVDDVNNRIYGVFNWSSVDAGVGNGNTFVKNGGTNFIGTHV